MVSLFAVSPFLRVFYEISNFHEFAEGILVAVFKKRVRGDFPHEVLTGQFHRRKTEKPLYVNAEDF